MAVLHGVTASRTTYIEERANHWTGRRSHRTRWVLVLTTALVVIVAVLEFALGRSTSCNTTTNTPKPTLHSTAVWTLVSSSSRFADQTRVASRFTHQLPGFTDPVVEGFQRGDTRSEEFPVRAYTGGPVTTVQVRELTSQNTWWVLGAVTANIVIDEPTSESPVASPQVLRGPSTTFESVVNVELRNDKSTAPISRTIVMGGSMGVMKPFEARATFDTPTAPSGALVTYIVSPNYGQVVEASVARIHFVSAVSSSVAG